MKLQRNADTFEIILSAITSGRLVLEDGKVYSVSNDTRRELCRRNNRITLSWHSRNYIVSMTNFVWMWHTRRQIKPEHVIIHRDNDRTNFAIENLVEVHADSQEAQRQLKPKSTSAKLTPEQVLEIRELAATPEKITVSLSKFAENYGMSLAAIRDVILGKSFSYLPGALSELPKIGRAGQKRTKSENRKTPDYVLTLAQVIQARLEFLNDCNATASSLARKYNISVASMRNNLVGKSHAQLPHAITNMSEILAERRRNRAEEKQKLKAQKIKSKNPSNVIELPKQKEVQKVEAAPGEVKIKRIRRKAVPLRQVPPSNSIAPSREKHLRPRRDWKPRVVAPPKVTEFDIPDGYRIMTYSEVYQRLMDR